MKRPNRISSLVALAALSATPIASAEDSDIAELKAMVSAMKQTIDAKNARIATLEKQQAPQAQAEEKSPAKRAVKKTAIPGDRQIIIVQVHLT